MAMLTSVKISNAQSNIPLLRPESLVNRMLVVIDPHVDDPDRLAAGVIPGADILRLDDHQDSMVQITAALRAGKYQAVHVVSHGSPGCVYLGATELTIASLPRYRALLKEWDVKEIWIYGCEVAVQSALLELWHQLSGASMVASRHQVGAGQWQLDYQQGDVRTPLCFRSELQESYPNHFALEFTETTVSVGAYPASVAIGDLDGDGDNDLAVANSSDDNLSILLGNGDGSFKAQTTIAVGEMPTSVAIGDLDGDGDNDLAVANSYDNSLSILLNNGDSSFAAQPTVAVNTPPYSVAIGDLDGDGDNDLAVVTTCCDRISVLFGNGDGSFAAPTTVATGNIPYSVTIGDLDGDGDNDLAVVNYYDDSVSILISNGDGSFTAQATVAVGKTPTSVAIGDLDGDGDNDLAVANFYGDSISTLLGNGDGSFATQTTVAVGRIPYSVAIGDLDGDGDNDLAVANIHSDSASVLLTGMPEIIVEAATTTIAEGGPTTPYTLRLSTVPAAPVTVTLSPDAQLSTSVPSVTFAADASALTPQTITVTAVDDDVDEAPPHNGSIVHSIVPGDGDGANYPEGLAIDAIAFAITDNDTSSFTLSKTTATVSEAATTDVVTIVLTSQPTTYVLLSLVSSDTEEVTAAPTPLAFTATNWNVAQSVTLTGVDDTIDDGDQTSTITVSVIDSGSDDAFNTLANQVITVTTLDHDESVVTLSTPTPVPSSIPTPIPERLGQSLRDIDFIDNDLNKPASTPLRGTGKADRLRGTPQADIIRGGGGNDIIISGRKGYGFGRDQLFGQGGNDLIRGGRGKDLLDGGAGRDRLFGGSNRDQLVGGAGGDQLIGQGGKDILIGGRGNDRIAGGRGRDTIVYTSLKDGTDTLIGFKITQDLIDLRQIFSDAAFAGESGDTDFQRFSNFVQLLEVNGSTEIRVDTDGSGSGTDTVTLAIAQATTGLTSENIVIS